jgi:RNA polymerase sigma-70 factor (ECF subfamily)
MRGLVQTAVSRRMSESPENVLVDLAKSGSDQAFEELISRSWDTCMRLAVCHLRNQDDAVDEVQTAFWKAHTHLKTFSGDAKFTTWVSRIVINRCIMRLRSRKRMPLVAFDMIPGVTDGPWIRDTDRWSDPEQRFGSTEVAALVHHELARIPKLLRTALELRYVRGLSLDEIGVELGITVGAVKARVSRGNKYLRDRIEPHCGNLGLATLTR